MLMQQIPFQRFNAESRVVFFSGAGISAESGIATFRDPDGHWSKYDPMRLASPQGFLEDPRLVLDWYAARRSSIQEAQPSPGHVAITRFQKLFQNSLVITQNVDGLHQAAGNLDVIELHGNIHREKCFACGALTGSLTGTGETNYCTCGGMARPDVVWFGENLPGEALHKAFSMAMEADLFFSIGTSTQIYPAAKLPFDAQQNGAFVIEVNPEETPFSTYADVSFRGSAGVMLPKLYEEFYASLG